MIPPWSSSRKTMARRSSADMEELTGGCRHCCQPAPVGGKARRNAPGGSAFTEMQMGGVTNNESAGQKPPGLFSIATRKIPLVFLWTTGFMVGSRSEHVALSRTEPNQNAVANWLFRRSPSLLALWRRNYAMQRKGFMIRVLFMLGLGPDCRDEVTWQPRPAAD